MRTFQIKVLRTFRAKRQEERRGCEKLHNPMLCGMYSSPNIMSESKSMRLARYVAGWEKQVERKHFSPEI
jgi:hypothetical protein